MIKQETIQAFTIDQHPNKEAVFDWVRDNWHNLGEFAVDEFIASLNALAEKVNGKLDYSVCIFPDRSEFISLTEFDHEVLNALDADNCPLTGVAYDFFIITALKEGDIEQALSFLHNEGEYLYSDEGIEEYIEARELYFTEDGAFHS